MRFHTAVGRYGGGKMVPMTDANKVIAKAWIKKNIAAYVTEKSRKLNPRLWGVF